MSVTVGSRLGSYEVIGTLGAGGMGEVYRARDSKLNRDVAIKVLPALFAGNPERLARFERESQTHRRSPICTTRSRKAAVSSRPLDTGSPTCLTNRQQ